MEFHGANNFKKEFVPYFEGFQRIYVHNEEDEAGKKFVQKVSNLYPDKEVYEISSRRVDIDCKDPADLFLKNKLNLENLLETAKIVEKEEKIEQKNKVEKKKNFEASNPTTEDGEEEIAKHVQIGEQIMQELYIHYCHGRYYVYNQGVYTENRILIENKILEIDVNASKSLRSEVLEYIRIKTYVEDTEVNPKYINFKNGLFDIETEQLIEHTPEYFSTAQINAVYMDEVVRNAHVHKFLKDISGGNEGTMKVLLQMSGYCITARVDFQLSFMLYGPTARNRKKHIFRASY